ncbi:hypothetical protein KSC_104850 [Ktedonobacter sp. SOSP1-52]|nr:hypothetical protein KSC_104850 [Ktedonobacter sp. SOSP1-52]
MNLWDTALLLIAERPHQGNHIQAELSVRQCPSAFFLWSRWLVETRTCGVPASIRFEDKTRDPL